MKQDLEAAVPGNNNIIKRLRHQKSTGTAASFLRIVPVLPVFCFAGVADRTASAVFAAAGAAALSAAAVLYSPDHNGCKDQEDDQPDDKS